VTSPRIRRLAHVLALTCAASAGGGAAAGTRLYDNTGNPANTYYSSQGGAEAIDDLHLSSQGILDSLVFEYYDPVVGGSFSATATLYGNPAGLDLGTSPFAGPFVRSGLPRGRGIVSIALPPGLASASHVWVGVQFSSTTAGLVINSVPSTGSSHDLYLENGGFYWFNGNPKANFGVRLTGTPGSVSVDAGPGGEQTSLAPPHPNPFRDGTILRYTVAQRGLVRLELWDVTGRRVRTLVDGEREAGSHTARWSGRDDAGHAVGAGVYFVRLRMGSGVITRRVVLAP
jgi:hypothetical protein